MKEKKRKLFRHIRTLPIPALKSYKDNRGRKFFIWLSILFLFLETLLNGTANDFAFSETAFCFCSFFKNDFEKRKEPLFWRRYV